MPHNLIAEAETELVEIERKIAEMQTLQQRGEHLRMFITLGRQLYQGQALPSPMPVRPPPVVKMSTLAPRAGSKKDRILNAAAGIYLAAGAMQTRPMVERLESQGVAVSGADLKSKIGALSALLSRSDRFKSDKAAGGWVLVQPGLNGIESANTRA